MNYCRISHSLASEGSIITDAVIADSVIGVRSIIEPGSDLHGVITMGASEYETPEEKALNRSIGQPDIGIGRGTHIQRAIIDQNCRIGDDCRIGVNEQERKDGDYGLYYIRDGIIIISKNTIIPSGTRF